MSNAIAINEVNAKKTNLNLLIAGLPNSGKSTVFNGLTGGNARVGNWHGVTVKAESGLAKIGGENYVAYDLPGAYSLSPVTLEEKTAVNNLLTRAGVILYIIEGVTFPLAIKNVISLINRGKRVIVLINMVRELRKRGGDIDCLGLEKLLGVPVVAGEFNTKKGIDLIKKAILNYRYNSANLTVNDLEEKLKTLYTTPSYKQSVLDKITLNGFTGFAFFILAVATVFFLAFSKYGLGAFLSGFLSDFFAFLEEKLLNFLTAKQVNEFLKSVVVGGVFSAFTGVASFLPQTLIVYSSIILLEQTGYASRLAFISERAFVNTGINGRAVFSIFMGFGCTALSVASSGGLESVAYRKRVAYVSALAPCSAKIPVLSYLASFSENPLLFTLLLYFIGCLIGVIELILFGKDKSEKRIPLVIELPPYRIPKFKNFAKSLLINAKEFIIRICSVVFLIALAISVFSKTSFSLNYVGDNFKESILYYIGRCFSFITAPIGVNDSRISTAIISGFLAKEGVLTTLITLFGDAGLNLSFSSLFALATFIYLYTPCVTAIYAVGLEIGKKFAVKFAVIQFLIAILSSYLAYYAINYPLILVIVTAVIVIALIIFKGKK